MTLNRWIRRFHRWIAIAFTLVVAANCAAMAFGPPPMWLTCLPLLPLSVLLATGLWQCALPCLGSNRRAGWASSSEHR